MPSAEQWQRLATAIDRFDEDDEYPPALPADQAVGAVERLRELANELRAAAGDVLETHDREEVEAVDCPKVRQ